MIFPRLWKNSVNTTLTNGWSINTSLNNGWSIFSSNCIHHPGYRFLSGKARKLQKRITRREELQSQPAVEQFINLIMKDGMKATARKSINLALTQLAFDSSVNPLERFDAALDKVAPLIKITSSKRASKSILTPTPLNERERRRIAIKWIIEAADKKKKVSNLPFGERIGKEMLAILNDDSALLAKRESVHKQAVQERSSLIMFDRKITRRF
ncbi:ribosomal protein S7 domain-containing protein [Globomyces pollinis-pini]|nr:ribosomal protein S7 domain-containing protein [Globomyces pollinis-pini]KAJ2997256.1 hypothetical protein HDV02_005718 [Globomyces sp. JEL0801]